jgi:hypothetical protein
MGFKASDNSANAQSHLISGQEVFMRKTIGLTCLLSICLIACAYQSFPLVAVAAGQVQATAAEDLPPSPLEAFAARPTAKVVWSKTIGRLEGTEARATITALAVEDSTQTPAAMRGVRIDLEHLVPNPKCDQIYLAWRVMCRRANAAVFIEEARLDEVRTWLGRGAAQLRHEEYISQYKSGVRGKESTGLILCGYTFPGRTPSELVDLLNSAIDELRTAPR